MDTSLKQPNASPLNNLLQGLVVEVKQAGEGRQLNFQLYRTVCLVENPCLPDIRRRSSEIISGEGQSPTIPTISETNKVVMDSLSG